MKKLPYIRQGQQLTIDILNGIIKAINSSILERKEYDSMMADITRMFNSYQSKVDNFISKYQDVVDNTPGLMDLLQSYSTLASMVNGTYVASVGSVNITISDFDIQGAMERSEFESVRDLAERYPQYSSLLITEDTGKTTLVYNVAPFESTPIWVEINAIPGPQGPPGLQGIPGPIGEPGTDGVDGQITSIKGKVASLNECLELEVAPTPGDAYVVEDGDDVNLYVYVGGDHTLPNSWVVLDNIRGPAGPQGTMAEIKIQYSNYADGRVLEDVYDNHSFMIISENEGNTRHVIKLTPDIDFRIIGIEEDPDAEIPSAESSTSYVPATNKTSVRTQITIPYLKTIDRASIIDNDLHLQYRGTVGTTNLGKVVSDPPKIYFTNGFNNFNVGALREGDVVINTVDYSIHNVIGGRTVLQGSLQGPKGDTGPIGASFNLVGEWVTYGATSDGTVTPSADDVGNAYFLPADDGGHDAGIYVWSEKSPGVYGWVFAGNSQGPKGETGETGETGQRGSRITAGRLFYLDGGVPCAPENPDNVYQQNDLYLNTETWDLFRVTGIDPDPPYTITPMHIGNIKGLGITSITVDEIEEELIITYSDGERATIPVNTIYVSSTEYTKAGLVVHKTDSIDPTDKGVFEIAEIGEQSDSEDPGTFKIWGDAIDLQAPGTADAGSSKLLPRADHRHPESPALADKVNFSDIQNAQSALTNKVPSSKLLRESSFARVYRSLAEINASYTEYTSIIDVITSMADNSVAMYNIEVDDYANTPYPLNDSIVKIEKINNNRNTATVVRKAYNSIDNVDVFTGSLCGAVGTTYRWSGWRGTYRSPSQIPNASGTGRLPIGCSIVDLLNAIIVNNMYGCNFNICFSSASEDKITGLPENRTYGMLNITVPLDTTTLRMKVEFNSELGNGATEHYIGVIKRDGATVVDLVWKKIKTGSLVSLGGASATSGKYIRFARVGFVSSFNEVSGVFLVYDNNHLNYEMHTCVLTLSCLTGSTSGPVPNSVKIDGVNIDQNILNYLYVSFNPTYSGTANTFDFYFKQSSTYSSIVVEFLSSSARNNTTAMNPIQNYFDLELEYDESGNLITYDEIPTNGEIATFSSKMSTLPVYFPVSPLVPTTPSGPSSAVAKSYVDTTVVNPNILTNADFLVNDLGTAVYDVHDTQTVNNWKIKLTNTAGSYTVATKTLKSNNVDIATDYVHLYQEIPNPMFYNGKTVTFSAKAISTTGKWTLILWKGVSAIASVPWDTALSKTLTYAIPAGTFTSNDTFSVAIRGYSSTVLDCAKLEIGSIATAFSPAPNTMLITASPTSNSMAVNKEHLDEETNNLRTTLNDLFTRLVIAEASSQKIFFIKSGRASNISATQDGSSVSTGFTGVSSKTVVITLTKPANTSTYGYYFSGWTKDGIAITNGSDGFVINYTSNTSTLTFTYENGKGGTYQGDVSRYTITPGPTPEPY